MTNSALYVGKVVHDRLQPRRHHLHYRVFWLLLDVDELPRLGTRCWLFSHNRANVFSFHDRDHGAGTLEAPRAYVRRQLAAAGIDCAGGSIRLLCMPRVLGYVFNPISIYYCHGPEGDLRALLYEVNNTFGERYSYLIPVAPGHGKVIGQRCSKAFHVSPFMDMDLDYIFRVTVPGDGIVVCIRVAKGADTLLTTGLAGIRLPFNDRTLAWLFVTHPLLTLKVIGAIHWQALRLLLKGFRMREHPKPPAKAIGFPITGIDQRDAHV